MGWLGKWTNKLNIDNITSIPFLLHIQESIKVWNVRFSSWDKRSFIDTRGQKTAPNGGVIILVSDNDKEIGSSLLTFSISNSAFKITIDIVTVSILVYNSNFSRVLKWIAVLETKLIFEGNSWGELFFAVGFGAVAQWNTSLFFKKRISCLAF